MLTSNPMNFHWKKEKSRKKTGIEQETLAVVFLRKFPKKKKIKQEDNINTPLTAIAWPIST